MAVKLVEFKLDTRDFERTLAKLPDAVGGAALADATMQGAEIIRKAARRKAPKGRTKQLSESIAAEVTVSTRDRCEVEVGTDIVYAAIQEFGGVIRPRNAKMLAIPLTGGARAAGTPRAGGKLRLIKSKNGNLLLIDTAGRPQWVLKESVTIPAQPYLRPAFDENQARAVKKAGDALKKNVLWAGTR